MNIIIIALLSVLLIVMSVCLCVILARNGSSSREETRREYERHIEELEERLLAYQAASEERMARHDADFRRQSTLDIDLTLSPLRRRLSEFQQMVADT